MAHQSLYRKYRPATFDDVVGQQHIERTLRNAVAEGSVAHAYLFTGPRGTGKTTTARLLAKALLCERGLTGEPDGTCDQCIQVANGTHPDVREIDAASNTGVDNVREEIIGRVQFAPTLGRYKVYIIDEVHMLSTAAFNALLKTLEEPPPNVVFVLCTTHPHKVPETIHSRCQRFDFRRISVEEIADRLRYIAESEGYKVDRSAFTLMARHAEGGMRDAITTLEQLASFTGGEVTVDDVEGLLGEVDSAQLFEVAALIARRDIAGCFRWIAATAETGTDLAELVREFTGHVRDLFLIAAVGDASGLVDRTAEEISMLEAQAMEFGGPDRLARLIGLLGELASEMRWSSDPRLSLEVALTRMARPQGEMTLDALAERVEAIERGASVAPAGVPAASPTASGARGVSSASGGEHAARRDASGDVADAPTPATKPEDAPAPSKAKSSSQSEASETATSGSLEPEVVITSVPGAAGALDKGTVKRNWQAVLVEIKKAKPTRAQLFSSVEVDIDTDGKTLVLEFPSDQEFSLQMAEEPEMRELLRSALSKVFSAVPPFRTQLGRGAVRPLEPPAPEPVISRAAPEHTETVLTDDEPLPEYYETGAGFTEPTASHARPSGELESVLDQLGATIVSEHAYEPDGEDE
ncbi:MAG: DNA polymerase III subunit gamma/tau [Actinobacteria bacterium HGW-Actinobacteria-7]|jgi:DNA polymerase-3 subunit gamma/tau|nr:MAG: DNA polymerase III subunit gamma/tau [Actinobacteria bacterium HGW-Actinobacteria-7]